MKTRTVLKLQKWMFEGEGEMKYYPPTKFCAFPALSYWELDGKPVSAREAEYGLKKGVILKETEITKDLKSYIGYFETS